MKNCFKDWSQSRYSHDVTEIMLGLSVVISAPINYLTITLAIQQVEKTVIKHCLKMTPAGRGPVFLE